MKKTTSSSKGITAKLLGVNVLVCIAFGLVTVAVFFSFEHIKIGLKKIFTEEVGRIVLNAHIGRDLARVLTDSSLVITGFYGKEEFLDAGAERLTGSIAELIEKSRDERLKASLEKYRHRVRSVIEQCAAVNRLYREIEELDRKADAALTALRETVSERIFELTLEGEDTSGLRQLSVLIPGYLETLLRINVRFNRLGLQYFESPPPSDSHPILMLTDDLYARLQTLTASEKKIADPGRNILSCITGYREAVLQFHQVAGELRERRDEMTGEKESLLTLMAETDTRIAKSTEKAAAELSRQISGSETGSLLIFFASLPALIFAFFVTRSVGKSLRGVIQGLQTAFERVKDAGAQVAAASRQLSEDTQDQAAFLEQTSASLEEIASMTRQNAENAGRTDRIMKTSADAVHEAGLCMAGMTRFIAEISQSSEQVQDIIGVIDDIAFQTRLLALNAAVEAVRAGQAGAGFSVIAAEIQNLAAQSAKAARYSAAIIQDTVRKVKKGGELAIDANEAFARVRTGAEKVEMLVAEIAAASVEQAQGVDQVNEAVSEMDGVVQRNADHAEKLAGTSGEMNAQAGYMSRFVRELAELAGRERGQTLGVRRIGSLFSNIRGDIAGAFSAALISLPLSLGYGIVVFAPLGSEYASKAAAAGLCSTVVAGFLAARFGGNPVQITGPRAMLTLVLASLVSELANSPYLSSAWTECAVFSPYMLISGLAAVSVFIGGLFQVLLSLLRFANLIKYIPHPVIAGFVNGIAMLLILILLMPLAGAENLSSVFGLLIGLMNRDAGIQPLTLTVGLVTLCVIFFCKRFVSTVPPPLSGLVVGTLLYYIFAALLPSASLGGIVSRTGFELPGPDVFLNLLCPHGIEKLRLFFPDLLVTGLVLGLIGSLETLLSSAACVSLTGERCDSQRELLGQGIGNIAASFFGAVSGGGSVFRTAANFRAGGRTPLSGMMCSLFLCLIMLLLGPVIAKIPLAVIAGIIIAAGIGLFDDWTVNFIRQRRNPLHSGTYVRLVFLVTFGVMLITLSGNLIAAVGLGVVGASALFAWKKGSSPVRRTLWGNRMRSKKMRTPEQIEILEKEGDKIEIFEMEGPVFFRSAEKLAKEIEASAKKLSVCILDMKRVNMIDAAGFMILLQEYEQFEKQGKSFFFAGMKENAGVWEFIEILGTASLKAERLFADIDSALDRAEDALLASLSESAKIPGEVRPEDMNIVRGFTPRELEDFKEKLIRQTYKKGEAVFREGDPGKDLFLLTKGSVTVKVRLPDTDRFKRLFTFSPGVVFGEVALLDGKPRSADVWAEEDSEVYRLSLGELDVLRREKPEIVIKLLLNIAKEFSRNLRRISNEVKALEDT